MSYSIAPPAAADTAALLVRDDAGNVISRDVIDPASAAHIWSPGAESLGHSLLEFSVEFYEGANRIGVAAPRFE